MNSTSNVPSNEQSESDAGNQPSGKFYGSKVLFKQEYENLDHTLIKISEEKLRLELNKYEPSVKSRYAWLAPFGVFVTLTTAIITTDFKGFAGLDKEHWEAVYYIGSLLSLAYSVMSFVKHKNNYISVDKLIKNIKNEKT